MTVAVVAPPDSTFAGAVNAGRVADRYADWLARDGGFHAPRVEPG